LARETQQGREINQADERWLPVTDWVCECADETCIERLELEPEEYERLRENSSRFAVLPSEKHFVRGVERILEQHKRYWIVENVGKGAAAMARLHPRLRISRH
jgi:hypothetical protein